MTNTRTAARITVVAALVLSMALLWPRPARAAALIHWTSTVTGTASVTGVGEFTFDGSGPSRPFGRVKNHGMATVDGVSTQCPGGLANHNVETFTVPGGDTLTVTSVDVACPNGALAFTGTGTWTLTSGTGRFAHATGNGTLRGHGDFVSETFTFTADGNITFP